MKFKKDVIIAPAYDKRNPDPNKNYGIHGCDLRMMLTGDKGVVQFVLFTGWHLDHVEKELKFKHHGHSPIPADVGYHSPVPLHDWQEDTTRNSCEYLDGKPCYYDGSGLHAEKVFTILKEKGSDEVWEYLEEYYYETFNESS